MPQDNKQPETIDATGTKEEREDINKGNYPKGDIIGNALIEDFYNRTLSRISNYNHKFNKGDLSIKVSSPMGETRYFLLTETSIRAITQFMREYTIRE